MARLVSDDASAVPPCRGRSLATLSTGPTGEAGDTGAVVSRAIVGNTSVAPVVDAGGSDTRVVVSSPVVVGVGLVAGVVDVGRGGCVDGESAVVSPASRNANADTTMTASAVVTTAATIHGPRLRRGRCATGTAARGSHEGPWSRVGGGTIGVPTGGDVTPPQPAHHASPVTMIRPHHPQLAGIAIETECTDAVRRVVSRSAVLPDHG